LGRPSHHQRLLNAAGGQTSEREPFDSRQDRGSVSRSGLVNVCNWHKADIPQPALQCPLLGVKRTWPVTAGCKADGGAAGCWRVCDTIENRSGRNFSVAGSRTRRSEFFLCCGRPATDFRRPESYNCSRVIAAWGGSREGSRAWRARACSNDRGGHSLHDSGRSVFEGKTKSRFHQRA